MSYIALFSRRTRLRSHLALLAQRTCIDLVSCVNPEPLVWQDALIAVTDLPMAKRLIRAEIPPRRRAQLSLLVATWDEAEQPDTAVWDIAETLRCEHVTMAGTASDDWYVDCFRAAVQIAAAHP